MSTVQIDLPREQIADFCRRWHITEFALFGSVLRDDFRPDSDIDVLITLEPGVYWPWGGYGSMTVELEAIFGRRGELAERPGVEHDRNPIRRRHIINSLVTIYAA